MVPLMVELLKIRQHQAHGTSLVAVAFTGLTGAIAYGLEGSVDIFAALALGLTSIVTVRAGAKFTETLPEWRLKRYFGLFLIFVALLLLLKPQIPTTNITATLWSKTLVLLFTGALTGFLSGMMGVGGGTVVVPAMVLLIGLSQHTAQGTSLLVMVLTGAVGAWTHWKLGHVVSGIVPSLIVGVLLGTPAGARFAHFLPENQLRLVFAVFLTIMGIRYLLTRPTGKREAKQSGA